MTDEERYALLGQVFKRLPAEFNGMEVKPLTAGRWDLLRERENTFLFGRDLQPAPVREDFAPGEQGSAEFAAAVRVWEEELEREERAEVFGICEYLWVCTAPELEVLELEDDPEGWRRAVKLFALQVADYGSLCEFMVRFRKEADAIAASMAEALPEEGEGELPGKMERSRTGSRGMSGNSAGTSARSGGGGSCGGSHSPRASNTCTPLPSTTGQPASGSGIPLMGLPPVPAKPSSDSKRSEAAG